ncbi:MAG: hypothetical protein R3C19_06225 [Planctomycetaceae bacterium]
MQHCEISEVQPPTPQYSPGTAENAAVVAPTGAQVSHGIPISVTGGPPMVTHPLKPTQHAIETASSVRPAGDDVFVLMNKRRMVPSMESCCRLGRLARVVSGIAEQTGGLVGSERKWMSP